MKNNLLVTLANEEYLDGAKQVFGSAYFKGGWDGDMMLLAYDVPEEKLKWFRKKGIHIKNCGDVVSETKYNEWARCGMSKLYLFTPYFKKWNRVIFLDADVIVRTSLGPLIRTGDFVAVSDFFSLKLKDQFIKNKNEILYNEIGVEFNLNAKAFNTGVFVFSPDKVITDTTFDDLIYLADKYGDIIHTADQAVLNLFFYSRFSRLPAIYNVFCYEFRKVLPKIFIGGAIIHGISRPKPWEKEFIFHKEWEKNFKNSSLIKLKPSKSRLSISLFYRLTLFVGSILFFVCRKLKIIKY